MPPSPNRGRRVRATLLLTVGVLVSALGSPATASADRIADKRAEAARVAAEIHHFDMRLALIVERFDAARARLGEVRADIRANRRHLARARGDLRAAQARLAEVLLEAYKNGENDVAFYVLGSGSFTDLIDRWDYVDRASQSQSDLVAQIRATEREIRRRAAALRAQRERAAELVREAAASRDEIRAALREREDMLAGINADIRRLIAEEEARRERLARQAAARAAREAAEQAAAAEEAAEEAAEPATPSSGGAAPAPSSPPPTPAPPPAGSLGQQAAAIAMRYLGVPYVWGGASPSGFDCSGLVMYAYAQVGISLPHYTGALWTSGAHVSRDQLAPGDLVFFYNLGHVGIYLGGGSFVHAPSTGDVVKVSSLNDSWYASAYVGAVRVAG
jgi:cell wall-associated NlpC family hydrolase